MVRAVVQHDVRYWVHHGFLLRRYLIVRSRYRFPLPAGRRFIPLTVRSQTDVRILVPVPADAVSAFPPPGPVSALREIAFALERAGAPTYRVRAFRRAAQVVSDLPPGELERRHAEGTLRALPGIGETTAEVISQAAAGQQPDYLTRVMAEAPPAAAPSAMRAALRGDCHTHSDWSDGGSPPGEMAEAARALGHEWIALTDHSPRLTVADGLSPERLEAQLALVERLNSDLAPFRILTGIEVDILDDGSLDQREDLLARLDVVVASVHSKLRMPGRPDDRADGHRGPQPARGRARALHRPAPGRAARGPSGIGVRPRGGVRGLP